MIDYFYPHHRSECPDTKQTFCGHCHECGDLVYAFLINGQPVCQQHHKEALSGGTLEPRTEKAAT